MKNLHAQLLPVCRPFMFLRKNWTVLVFRYGCWG